MVGLLQRQASLFSFAFFKEAAAIQDPCLERIDALLEDPALIALSTQVLATRSAHSATCGRTSIAPDRLLRCAVLKHLKGWSFRDLQKEVRASLLYRRFTRFYEDPIPHHTNLSRGLALFGQEGTRKIHEQLLQKARELERTAGKMLRTDTTVVESNIHYPTDSSLLADSLRVLTRSLQRIAQQCRHGQLEVVDHSRAAKHRVLEICRAARSLGESGRQRLQKSYGKLLALSRGVAVQAWAVLARLDQGELVTAPRSFLRILKEQSALRHYLPLVEQVITQTHGRVFAAETRCPGKILSLFEPHSVVVRKGKAHKPNEFGRAGAH
jgi:IS5 family transposase